MLPASQLPAPGTAEREGEGGRAGWNISLYSSDVQDGFVKNTLSDCQVCFKFKPQLKWPDFWPVPFPLSPNENRN